MNSLLERLFFTSNDKFYHEGILDYSKIPVTYNNIWPEKLRSCGITDEMSVMLYFSDNKLLMPIIIALQAFHLEIHLANKNVLEYQMQYNTNSIQFFITDTANMDCQCVNEIQMLDCTLYIYKGQSYINPLKITNDNSYVFYTSGTTGVENQIVRTQSTLIAEATAILDSINFCSNDTILCNAPSFHSFGQAFGNFAACLAGCKVHYIPSFILPSHIIHKLKFFKYDILISTPYYYNMIFKSLKESNGLKYMLSAGGKLGRDTINSGIKINNVYGTTETGAMCIQQYIRGGNCGSVGTPIKGVQIMTGDKIFKENEQEIFELYVDSNYMYKYKIVEEKIFPFTQKHFDLGDLGYFDTSGNLQIYGRKDDIVNIHGEKVSLTEIESVLCSNDFIESSKVIYQEDSGGIGHLEAYVVIKKECTPNDILVYCKIHLNHNKIPRHIKIVDELKRSETGKVINQQKRGDKV